MGNFAVDVMWRPGIDIDIVVRAARVVIYTFRAWDPFLSL